MNYSRYEAYVFLTDKENEDNLDIRLINLEEKKLVKIHFMENLL